MSSDTHRRSAVTSVGGLLPSALLARILEPSSAAGSLEGTGPETFGLAPGEKISEATNRSWSRLIAVWDRFSEARSTCSPQADMRMLTRERWLNILFEELGYGRLPAVEPIEIEGKQYPVSHRWESMPLLLLGVNTSLYQRVPLLSEGPLLSAHASMQELLNRSEEFRWAIIANGSTLRLLHDNVSLTRQAYVEFDLERLFGERIYSDFVLLWCLLHRSRVEGEVGNWWLDRWKASGHESGARALDKLRGQVEAAITTLGTGFLTHPANSTLRADLRSGSLSVKQYHKQLLRMIYRLLFLLVAEDRSLLHPPGSSAEAQGRYRFYSLGRIRDLAGHRRGDAHSDLWVGLQMVMRGLGSETGLPALGLPGMGGHLWSSSSVSALSACKLSNRALLEALLALGYVEEGGARLRVDFRNLGAEELGSVYEALLDLQPEMDLAGATYALAGGGEERHASGSHYTPASAIRQVLDFALEPAILDCLARPTREDQAEALLSLKVLDPACGSGHFLVAAARRIAYALAAVRSGEKEPTPEDTHGALREVVGRCVYGIDLNPMAVDLCKVALWLETLEPGKPLGFLDHHIQVGNALLGVPVGTTVLRRKGEVISDAGKADARSQHLSAERVRLQHLMRDDPRLLDLTEELKKVLAFRKKCAYHSWADAIPDSAYSAYDAQGTTQKGRKEEAAKQRVERAKAATKRNRQQRQRQGSQLQLPLHTVALRLPAHLAEAFDALGNGTDESVAELTIRAAAYADARREADYLHMLEQADTWTATFFWPYEADSPPVPTHSDFVTLQAQAQSLAPAVSAQIAALAKARTFFHPELAFPEVFEAGRGGFDVVIGNPPYLGGLRITTHYGDAFVHFLKSVYEASGKQTNLAAYFVQRSYDMLREGGHLAFITTNSITETSARRASLDLLVQWKGEILDAVTSHAWEGAASVGVVVLHVGRAVSSSRKTLDGKPVSYISSRLDDTSPTGEEPRNLSENQNKAFQGTIHLGDGFILDDATGRRLRSTSPNELVVRPYLGATAITTSPTLEAGRWIIDFEGRSEIEARKFTECWSRIEQKVLPVRQALSSTYPESAKVMFWQFYCRREELYGRLSALKQVIVLPITSVHSVPVLVPAGQVMTSSLAVVCYEDHSWLALLTSQAHWWWLHTYGFSMGDATARLRYSLSDVFETFPVPSHEALGAAADVMERLDASRGAAMKAREVGITKLYNLFHAAKETSTDILLLRDLHAQLDAEVLAAYGWADLELSYGFYSTKTGTRWVLAPQPRAEMLRRLLALNHQRAPLPDPWA